MSEPVAGHLFGRYRLERQLGSGGMGAVWLARPVGPAAVPVVIKVLHSHLAEDERALRRFMDEVRLARLLRHPNLVEFLEDGQQDGVHFIAMEFVDGLQLRQCLTACGGPLSPSLAAGLFAQACAGLEYAHTLTDKKGHPLQLVHRDVAPDNLMVNRQGEVKLVDFGIARTTHTDLTTKAGDRRGKVRYVPPEYIKGAEATARSDVYSMGATLFEVCTGKRPFDEVKNLMDIANAIMKQGLPPAGSLNPSLPPELTAIIATATQRDPEKRFPSAGAMEQALRSFLAKHPAPSLQQIGGEVASWMERLGIKSSRTSAPAQAALAARPPVPAAGPRKAPADEAEVTAPRQSPQSEGPGVTVRSDLPLAAKQEFDVTDRACVPPCEPTSANATTVVSELPAIIAATMPRPASEPQTRAPARVAVKAAPRAPAATPPAPRPQQPAVEDDDFSVDIDLDSNVVLPQVQPPPAATSRQKMPATPPPVPLASVLVDESLFSAQEVTHRAPRPKRPPRKPNDAPASTVIVSEELGADVVEIPAPPKPKGRR